MNFIKMCVLLCCPGGGGGGGRTENNNIPQYSIRAGESMCACKSRPVCVWGWGVGGGGEAAQRNSTAAESLCRHVKFD